MPKAYNPNDSYFRLAQQRGYRARSAFKLEEVLNRFKRILPPKAKVLDLGCAPGSFLQILGEKVKKGKICGVDLQKMKPLPKNYPSELKLIQGDVFKEDTEEKILEFFKDQKADLITSDMAPKTSGIKSVDQWKSIELNQRVLEICDKLLKKDGNLVAKIFRGEDFDEFWVEEFRDRFKEAKTFKPKSCRDRSVELFLVGIGWQGALKEEGQDIDYMH